MHDLMEKRILILYWVGWIQISCADSRQTCNSNVYQMRRERKKKQRNCTRENRAFVCTVPTVFMGQMKLIRCFNKSLHRRLYIFQNAVKSRKPCSMGKFSEIKTGAIITHRAEC